MGFLSWWENNKSEESASQLDLQNQPQKLAPQRKRVDGATVNRRFTKAMQDCGGSPKVYPRAFNAETQELFDCSIDELYNETGGKPGDRSTLPVEAQEAYMVNEALSTHELYAGQDCDPSRTEREADDRIVETVKATAKEVRSRWLPW